MFDRIEMACTKCGSTSVEVRMSDSPESGAQNFGWFIPLEFRCPNAHRCRKAVNVQLLFNIFRTGIESLGEGDDYTEMRKLLKALVRARPWRMSDEVTFLQLRRRYKAVLCVLHWILPFTGRSSGELGVRLRDMVSRDPAWVALSSAIQTCHRNAVNSPDILPFMPRAVTRYSALAH